MINPKYHKYLWLLWIISMPSALWFAYEYYPPLHVISMMDAISFLLLAAICASMPILINNSPIFLLQWISVAVFLQFGLFAELIIAQFAIFVLLIRLKIHKGQMYRWPLNSLLFLFVSLSCGLIYYAIGGKTGDMLDYSITSFLLVLSYPILYYALNMAGSIFVDLFLRKMKSIPFGEDIKWDAITSLLTFPVGYALFILYQEIGIVAVLCVGVPFASISIILNLYSTSKNINNYLKKSAEIGHQLAERMSCNEVIDLFINELTKMLPVDYAYVLDVDAGKELKLVRSFENGVMNKLHLLPLKKGEGISGYVWKHNKAVTFRSRKDWERFASSYIPDRMESVLCVPIIRHSEVTSILFLGSNRKAMYEKPQRVIVDILCTHVAIAIENAKHYEETKEKSERCALTKLFNYRYLENELTSEFMKLKNNERKIVSLIILDLDHFKTINDTYGHQSGNEILRELAYRLVNFIGDSGTVARYGGEEFVVLLPDVPKEEALHIAECIRGIISSRPFVLKEHIEADEVEREVTITASLGVATAPYDAEDHLTLIRHADRALYNGAKRAGRNKVAQYVK